MTRPDDAALVELLDRQAVIEACYRYSEAVDRTCRESDDEAFAAYADTMTEDCVVDYGPLGRYERRADWIAFARGLATRGGLSHHMYANFFVEIDGDTARARFHAQAMHYWADELPGRQVLTGAAIFHNELRRTPDGWKLTRVHPDIQFLDDPGDGAARMFPQATG